MSLNQLQNHFVKACLVNKNSQANVESKVSEYLNCSNISAAGIMGIYRNSVIANITSALKLTYPVIEKLLGIEFFQALSREYIQRHWPTKANMDDYGESFALFIAEFPHTRNYLYLPEVAQLEWLFHQSSLADDPAPYDSSKLTQLDFEQLAELNFQLPPSAFLMSAKYPVEQIWALNQDNVEDTEKNLLDLSMPTKVNLLVLRKDLQVNIIVINDIEMALLTGVQQGKKLLTLLTELAEHQELTVLAQLVQKHFELGTLLPYNN